MKVTRSYAAKATCVFEMFSPRECRDKTVSAKLMHAQLLCAIDRIVKLRQQIENFVLVIGRHYIHIIVLKARSCVAHFLREEKTSNRSSQMIGHMLNFLSEIKYVHLV